MGEKIKNLFGFIGRAWSLGIWGKFGVMIAIFSIFVFTGIFFGQVSVQKFVINIWRLDAEQTQLAAEQEKLNTLNHHIELLQNYSPDYVEELGLKYLNIGDANARVLKI